LTATSLACKLPPGLMIEGSLSLDFKLTKSIQREEIGDEGESYGEIHSTRRQLGTASSC
jgi:hypothetical protein